MQTAYSQEARQRLENSKSEHVAALIPGVLRYRTICLGLYSSLHFFIDLTVCQFQIKNNIFCKRKVPKTL